VDCVGWQPAAEKLLIELLEKRTKLFPAHINSPQPESDERILHAAKRLLSRSAQEGRSAHNKRRVMPANRVCRLLVSLRCPCKVLRGPVACDESPQQHLSRLRELRAGVSTALPMLAASWCKHPMGASILPLALAHACVPQSFRKHHRSSLRGSPAARSFGRASNPDSPSPVCKKAFPLSRPKASI
jgi:hypothetical protein